MNIPNRSIRQIWIDKQFEKAQAILDDLDSNVDRADNYGKHLAAHTFLTWRAGESDPDMHAAIIEEIRDHKGGKDRPILQLVNYLYAKRALNQTHISIKNQVVSAVETLLYRTEKYLPQQPKIEDLVAKIDDWGGGDPSTSLGKIHESWMRERSRKAREIEQRRLEAEKKQRESDQEREAIQKGFPSVEALLDYKMRQEEMRMLRIRLSNIARLIPTMIANQTAIPVTLTPTSIIDDMVYFGHAGQLYSIVL